MTPLRTVLIANRGEIAVRIIRAAADAGLRSVAVYAESDRDALHVRLADEAFALPGRGAAQTYLNTAALLEIAERAGADALHPGYGFGSEDAAFAQAVIDAGLTWIGPSPSAIAALGDKVRARRIAREVGAPLLAGTPDPVADAEQALAFAAEFGLPVAIKAVAGGGGRGLRVARSLSEVPRAFEAATREAVAAFGRGDCFLERFLERPRHVETQCLADAHGQVVIVSTRDCSMQRRHQKLLEEAPAPFLTSEQEAELARASAAILRAVDYQGAATCEFLLDTDGTLAFLEVNTRLQVEHPVSEEITGLDLVVEQFRIAAGEPLGYTEVHPRGHALEFRINAEDAGRGFLPSTGVVSDLVIPAGPGIRWDSGVVVGDEVTGEFDSLLAKLIVFGQDREQALARARRALAELRIQGLPTLADFHRAVVDDPAFAPEPGREFAIHTGWVESEFDTPIAPFELTGAVAEHPPRTTVVVEVSGRRLEVTLPAGAALAAPSRIDAADAGRAAEVTGVTDGAGGSQGEGLLRAPMTGTVVTLVAAEGASVDAGEVVLLLEAMKMEHPVTAPTAGILTMLVSPGDAVTSGDVLARVDPHRVDADSAAPPPN
ncbi:acetyl/propionyl/methylcrotonyl-CoA carboxylase subunit alpha [Dermacoccaceae bacterium W4C1]